MNKVTTNVEKQMNDQKNTFEELKRKKLEKQHEGLISPSKSKKFLKRNLNNEDQVVNDIETQMNKEIENFIKNNNEAMNKALDELKKSFEDEITQLDGNYFINQKLLI